MDDTQRKEFIRHTFNAVAPGYDRPALQFFPASALHLVEHLGLNGSERVLDVATGTGAVAIELAKRLPDGSVLGVDMADEMLAQASLKAATLGLGNVRFQLMDMTALEACAEDYDCATASFALFFVEDMTACLRGIVAKLKRGGRIVGCCFTEISFVPYADLFLKRIEEYGAVIPPISWKRLALEAQNQELFTAAGLQDVQMTRHDISYFLPNAEAWWDILWYAGFRGLLNQLSATDLQRFRDEHLAEIAELTNHQGIRLPVEVLYTRGIKPSE